MLALFDLEMFGAQVVVEGIFSGDSASPRCKVKEDSHRRF